MRRPLLNLPKFIVDSLDIEEVPVKRKPVIDTKKEVVNNPKPAKNIAKPKNKPKPSVVVVGSNKKNSKKSGNGQNSRRPSSKVEQRVRDRLQTEDRVRIIVNLNDKDMQEFVLNQLDSFEKAVDMKNGFAGYVDIEDLQLLEASGLVDSIVEDRPLKIANAESFPLINVDKANNSLYNGYADLTGEDQTVCIIDTGVDYNHDDLGNCVDVSDCPKVPAGYDYYNNDGDYDDDNGHGTAIAGIIAGNGSGYQGIAPEAKIVALKVTDSAGDTWSSHLENAVRWCIDNRTKFNITIISIGLATTTTEDDPSYCEGSYGGAVGDAYDANLIVIAPTGNDEHIDGVSEPACNPKAISVSAVGDGSNGYTADVIPTFPLAGEGPNRYPGITDLMAPGISIDTLWKGPTDYAYGGDGTSFASAHAVGSAMLLREYFQERYNYTLNPAQIRNILTLTGKPIWDVNTSAYYPRIDLLRAIHYEFWAPKITLENDQVVNFEPGNADITLEFNVVDNEHEVINCSLYVNGVVNKTYEPIVEGDTYSQSLYNLPTGHHDWKVECYDNSTIPNKGTSWTYDIYVEPHVYRSNAGMQLIGLDKIFNYDKKIINTTWPSLSHAYLEGKGDYDLTGRGQTVCVIDSGINDYFHQEFNEGKQLAEADFYENDGEAQDRWNHGSRVAGIMFAKGVNMQGIAHNANFVNIRLGNSSGGEWTNDLVNGLDFCYNNRDKYNITTVYFGFGTGLAHGSETSCTTSSSTGQRIEWLTQANISVVIGSGISDPGNYTRVNYPSCVKNAITVGAVPSGGGSKPADTWNVTAGGYQSNRRYDILDILAPGGSGATATTNRTNYIGSTRIGTHIATAYVAGSIVLFNEYWDERNWNYSPSGLVNGNIPNTIAYIFLNPGQFYPRLDMYKAINYEEWVPEINLETPANAATENESIITFEYNVADTQHNIKNCSLYINGSLDQTDISVTENVTQSFTKFLTAGTYDWEVKCYDNSSVPNLGVSGTRTLTVENNFIPEFQEGMTYTSWINNDYLQTKSDTSLGLVNETGANYVSLLVTWYQDTTSSTNIFRNTTKTPSDAALIDAINKIHSLGMKVTLKPHVDVNNGSWRGDISFSTEPEWNEWFANYTAFINYYADLAEANGVEQFIVGTELKSTTSRQTDWENVISSVRSKFSGSLTYAANHDNYNSILWWDKLDYAGIDAYFALTAKEDPTLAELKTAWITHRDSLNTFYTTWNKPILFTEIGYQNINGTNIHPWWSTGAVDEQEQADCYRAAFETVWNESWFYGMYWWDWYWDYDDNHDNFGLYNKPAELVVKEYYGGTICAEDWQSNLGTCQTDDTQLKTYTDNNICGTTNDLPGDNGTYVACNYCSYSVINSTWSLWQDVGTCLINDTQEQNRSMTEYDEDYSICYAVTTLPTDLWNSGNNNTYWDYQSIACDFCTPSMINTSWSVWINVSACYANNTVDQMRNLTQYDNNYCGEVSNTTYFEYQYIACDACTPSMVNTSWSSWYDVTVCQANDTIQQERNLTEFDNNYCGEVSNTTYFEYQYIACDFCTPDWQPTNTSCQPDDNLTQYYTDVNTCYATTGLADDLLGKPANQTFSCNYANDAPNITGVPNQNVDEDTMPSSNWIDLWNYTTDVDNTSVELSFIVSLETNNALINCSIISDRYVDCAMPSPNASGFSDITVEVSDGQSTDSDIFRVIVNSIDDLAVWNPLSNQDIDEDSPDGTLVYPDLLNQCSDVDNTTNMQITSIHSHYDLVFNALDLIINNLETDWFGTETVDLDCNGVSNSFGLTVNDTLDITCRQVCYSRGCYEVCE